jgi:hypothetical protein
VSCYILSLSQADRLVLGSDLNRSESRCGAIAPVRFCPVAEETAAPQDFESAYVRIGSNSTELAKAARPFMSAVLRKREAELGLMQSCLATRQR